MILQKISGAVVSVAICSLLLIALWKKVPVFEAFLSGAKEGLTANFSILPSLVGLLTAVGMLQASGAMELLTGWMAPVAEILHFPREILPLALLRPISGSGALALLENTIQTYGPDSGIGRMAAVLAGASETTFYTMTVYFGTVGIKKTRYALPAALVGDGMAFLMAGVTIRLFYP